MARVIGLALCLGFAWFAIDAFAVGEYLRTAVFVVALLGTLLQLLREGSEDE